MRVVVQRVREAEVVVDDHSVARIGRGLLVLAGLGRGDGPTELAWMARKVVGLRVFDRASEGGQDSVVEVGGELMVVSQFTLLADCRQGRRPSYDRALPADVARPLFERFVDELRMYVRRVATGIFGADMSVRLVNDGPFTLVIDHDQSSPTRAANS